MAGRVASDAVPTHRATLARSGGTRRPCLRLPEDADLDLAAGDLVRLVLDGTTSHARVDADARGLLVRGAYDNRRLAREDGREGENRLVEWVDGIDRGPGDSVEFDVVTAGDRYGLRVPGRRAVYTVSRTPKDSLASIAESLDGDESR